MLVLLYTAVKDACISTHMLVLLDIVVKDALTNTHTHTCSCFFTQQ